ncbi:hypothetical protein DXG03_006741, partial [Asterophora parasitica]
DFTAVIDNLDSPGLQHLQFTTTPWRPEGLDIALINFLSRVAALQLLHIGARVLPQEIFLECLCRTPHLIKLNIHTHNHSSTSQNYANLTDATLQHFMLDSAATLCPLLGNFICDEAQFMSMQLLQVNFLECLRAASDANEPNVGSGFHEEMGTKLSFRYRVPPKSSP